MNTKDTGGPAFPDPGRAQSAKQREVLSATGMTLRDYFASMAMQGFAADLGMGEMSTADIAKLAYIWADAMLKARQE